MNNTQKISLICGIVFAILWLLGGLENGWEFIAIFWLDFDQLFDEWYLMISFALSVGSFLAYYLFKSKD